jgi:hypothetical protein
VPEAGDVIWTEMVKSGAGATVIVVLETVETMLGSMAHRA